MPSSERAEHRGRRNPEEQRLHGDNTRTRALEARRRLEAEPQRSVLRCEGEICRLLVRHLEREIRAGGCEGAGCAAADRHDWHVREDAPDDRPTAPTRRESIRADGGNVEPSIDVDV